MRALNRHITHFLHSAYPVCVRDPRIYHLGPWGAPSDPPNNNKKPQNIPVSLPTWLCLITLPPSPPTTIHNNFSLYPEGELVICKRLHESYLWLVFLLYCEHMKSFPFNIIISFKPLLQLCIIIVNCFCQLEKLL